MTRVVPFRPPGFTPAGKITWARVLPENVYPFRNLRSNGFSRAQRAGKKFEERVLRHLHALYPGIENSRWLQFDDGERTRFCQPDAYNISDACLTIFEIKLSHTPVAELQMRQLYAPVLQHIFPTRILRLIEIVRVFEGKWNGPLYLDFAEFQAASLPPEPVMEVLRWRL